MNKSITKEDFKKGIRKVMKEAGIGRSETYSSGRISGMSWGSRGVSYELPTFGHSYTQNGRKMFKADYAKSRNVEVHFITGSNKITARDSKIITAFAEAFRAIFPTSSYIEQNGRFIISITNPNA